MKLFTRIAATIGLLTLGNCTNLPPARLAGPDVSSFLPSRSIVTAATGHRELHASLDILTFNIEGLGWPARRGRAAHLRRIGTLLERLNAAGEAPDVIMVQEMFSPAAVRAVTRAGYGYRAWGPSRTTRRRMPVGERVGGPYYRSKGEVGFHLVGSGLAILSRYPIVATGSEPFGSSHCAGFDCLSNKGVQHVRIVVPGVPEPVDIFNAHLNSQSASRVPRKRNGAAHALQVDDLAGFLAMTTGRGPRILGGDFNMRGAPRRLARFDAAIADLTMVHRYCIVPANACDARISWDGDAPWMDTEDLQLFRDGASVTVRPIRVEAMFDGSAGSPQLSDHDGFRVTYRLGWGMP